MKKVNKRQIMKLIKIINRDNYLDVKNELVTEPYDEFYRYVGKGAMNKRYFEVLTVNDVTRTYSLKVYKNGANYFLDVKRGK